MIEPYANLRVAFSQDSEGAGDVYRIVASLDDGPQTESTFTLPMSAESIRREVRSIAVTRSAAATRVARVVDDEPAGDGSALGERLASALFTPDIETLVDQAREQGRFRLALNFTSEPELLQIPWELLRRNGWDLASHTDSTIVRELDTKEKLKPQQVQGRLKMLVVIANPRDDLDVEGEQRKIAEAVSGSDSSQVARTHHLDAEREIDVRFLPNCTYTHLQRALQHDRYHILHFVGHSAATAGGQTKILLTGDDGAEQAIDGNPIAQLIGGHRSLQLVVFNSCEGARTAQDNAFSSFATMLVQQGMSAVIAMQFEIGDAAAKAFAGELYYSLIKLRYPIDAAVAEARKAIYPVSPAEFATPVLFLRAGRADLFDFVEPAKATPRWAIPAAAAAVALLAAGGTFLATRLDAGDTAATPEDSGALAAFADAALADTSGTTDDLGGYGGFVGVTEVYDATEQCLETDVFSPGPASALLTLDGQTMGAQLFLCDQAWAGLDDRGGPTVDLANTIDERLDDALRILDSAGGSEQAAGSYEQEGNGLREELLLELNDRRAADAATLDAFDDLDVYGEFVAVTDVFDATERCLETDLFSPGPTSVLLSLSGPTIDVVTFLCDEAWKGLIDVEGPAQDLADAVGDRIDDALSIYDAAGGSASEAARYEQEGEGLRSWLLQELYDLRSTETDE